MPSVALVTIAKNEERCIKRLIDSVSDSVDEIIVLDTGSSDGTVDIARAAGATVRFFNWSNDFSAARNCALNMTVAPWRLVLDADEWVSPATSNVRDICKQEPDFVGRINIQSTFMTNVAGHRQVSISHSWISRLLPVGVTYSGRIHEQPTHSLSVRDVGIHVLHDGYEDHQIKTKGDRNFNLLESVIRSGCEDEYYFYQYAKELLRKKRFEEAAEHVAYSLKRVVKDAPWRGSLVLVALRAFAGARNFKAGLEVIERESFQYRDSVAFFFESGQFYMDIAQNAPQLVQNVLSLIENSFLRCLEIGEASNTTGVEGKGSYLAAQNLYAFYVATNQPEKAKYFSVVALSRLTQSGQGAPR